MKRIYLTSYHESSIGIDNPSKQQQPGQTIIQAALLGFVTGIRSMTPLALLSWTSSPGSANEPDATTLEQLLAQPRSRIITLLSALGEGVGDKLPITPSRISPLPLLGRLLIGGVVGMILYRRVYQPPAWGILSGATGAALGAVASTTSRAWLSKKTKTPQALWGVLEDIVALSLSLLALRVTHISLTPTHPAIANQSPAYPPRATPH